MANMLRRKYRHGNPPTGTSNNCAVIDRTIE
jgi:hypothetical protein